MSDTNGQGDRLAFPIPEELTREMLAAIGQIRDDAGDKAHVTALVDVILKLTDAGLGGYYVLPLERAGAGLMALGTAKVGISAARRGISAIANKVIRGMSKEQLLSIADSMESMLIR